MQIKQILEEGIQQLRKANIEEPIRKAKMLLAYVLKKPKEYLMIQEDLNVEPYLQQQFDCGIKKLVEGKPIQYVINQQSFMKMDFYVDENVLIPQPDTEIVVEEILSTIQDKNDTKVLDIGTGSGAIGISIAKYTKQVEVYASDISQKAIQIAKLNSEKNQVHTRMHFMESDLFKQIPKMQFDIIVSNPPYIKTNVIPTLSEQVQQEPMLALDGGEDGLTYYRNIVQEAVNFLKPGGLLYLEIGFDQKKEVTQLLKENQNYQNIFSKQDLAGNDRVIMAKKVK